jgi:hypothetical protein
MQMKPDGDGQMKLIRLGKPRRAKAKVKIQYRKGTHAIATTGRPITIEQVRALLADFP